MVCRYPCPRLRSDRVITLSFSRLSNEVHHHWCAALCYSFGTTLIDAFRRSGQRQIMHAAPVHPQLLYAY
jgi:hypothetical protein